MIGPSSCTASMSSHEIVNAQTRSPKRKIFEDLDINNFCEEAWQNGRKRYLQELETPVDLIMPNETIDDNSPLLAADTVPNNTDDRSLARLKVLVVDGTNYTWTTMSDLDGRQIENGTDLTTSTSVSSPFSSSSSLSSSTSLEGHSQDIFYTDAQTMEETTNNYRQVMNDGSWEPVNPMVMVPPPSICQISRLKPQHSVQSIASNGHQRFHEYDDQENVNLSWLLDFKLDPFIASTDDKFAAGTDLKEYTVNKTKSGRGHGSTSTETKKVFAHGQDCSSPFAQKSSYAMATSNQEFASASEIILKKPPYTYTELIEHALRERGELTVSAIYQWISERFPYYKCNDDRWKNSVRHNLSINPHFRKGCKAPHGAGHLWTIANPNDVRPYSSKSRSAHKGEHSSGRRYHATNSTMSSMEELELATASIMRHSSEEENDDIVYASTLEHSAGEILSGMKKEVQVQYVVPMMIPNTTARNTGQQTRQHNQDPARGPARDSDFLNPVSKEEVAEECGLISQGYLITDANSSALGLNMVESEITPPENLFGEELNFQFYELSPSQMQSA